MTRLSKPRSRAIPYPARPYSVLDGALALLAGLAFLAAAFALAPSASAQVFSSTPYVAAPDPAVEQLRNRIEGLESDLKRATDRSEKLAYDLSQARKIAEEANAGRQKAEADIAALTLRVEALEGGGRSDSAGGPAASNDRVETTGNLVGSAASLANRVDISQLPQDEDGLLKEARNLLLDGNYPSAQEGFTAFLAKYGKGANAHEAQYLLGESLLYQDNYREAADAYGKLLSSYPKSPNGPNALVKLARSLRLLNKKTDACKALALMPQQFPKASDAAKQLASTERQRSNCK